MHLLYSKPLRFAHWLLVFLLMALAKENFHGQ